MRMGGAARGRSKAKPNQTQAGGEEGKTGGGDWREEDATQRNATLSLYCLRSSACASTDGRREQPFLWAESHTASGFPFLSFFFSLSLYIY